MDLPKARAHFDPGAAPPSKMSTTTESTDRLFDSMNAVPRRNNFDVTGKLGAKMDSTFGSVDNALEATSNVPRRQTFNVSDSLDGGANGNGDANGMTGNFPPTRASFQPGAFKLGGDSAGGVSDDLMATMDVPRKRAAFAPVRYGQL